MLLILPFIFPIVVKGQIETTLTSDEKNIKKPIFYNKGEMYVAPNATNATASTIYVQGSIKVVNGSYIRQIGVTSLIGDFIYGNLSTKNSPYKTVFRNTETEPSTGTIRFINTTLMNNPLKVAYGKADTSGGGIKKSVFGNIQEEDLISLNGIKLNIKQEIKFEEGVDKKTEYIDFPNVEVADKSYVALTSNSAATIKKLITDKGAVFSVEGRYKPASNSTTEGIQYGHLILTNKPLRKNNSSGSNAIFQTEKLQTDYSYHLLDVSLYDYRDFATNRNKPTSHNFTNAAVHLSGITSPFRKLSNSYFMFHTIFNPTSIWTNYRPNIDPKRFINAGEGYAVAMELSDIDHDEIESNWQVERENRAVGGFQFSSLFLAQKKNFLIGHKREITNPVSGKELTQADFENYWQNEEFLSTKNDNGLDYNNVKVELKEAANQQNLRAKFFLANPFLAPFELTALVKGIAANSDDAKKLGVTSGTNPLSNNLNAAFWVLNQSALEYIPNIMLNFFKLNYLSFKNAGSTGFLGADQASDRYFIAPQQIFAVEVGKLNGKVEFNFHPSYVAHNNSIATKSYVEPLRDEFLIQVINEEDKTEDRLAVVFRSDAEAAYGERGDKYDDRKDDLNYRFDSKAGVLTEQRKAAIYTKTIDGKEMRTNAVPTDTRSLPLYITPTVTPKRLVLKPYRLETLQSVEGVWLEDKQLKTITQLQPDMEYPFESTIETDKNAQQNRFILHFTKSYASEKVIETESAISCYYQNAVLYIKGLNSSDINSKLEIFDLQGRLITQTKVDNAPEMSYLKQLDNGTYIVRISGYRNYTTKFMSLQK